MCMERVLRDVSTGIVVVPHMPEKFTAVFAQRLSDFCPIDVRKAMGNNRCRTLSVSEK